MTSLIWKTHQLFISSIKTPAIVKKCQEITCFQRAEPYKTIQRKTRIFHKITLHPAVVCQSGLRTAQVHNAPQATPLALIKRWRLSWTLCESLLLYFTRLLSPFPAPLALWKLSFLRVFPPVTRFVLHLDDRALFTQYPSRLSVRLFLLSAGYAG